MLEIDNIVNMKIPRWDQLPDFGIYKDQLITIVKDILDPIFIIEEEFITPSMVNNYVKLKRMPEPIKKKYYKKHIASIIVITALKQILSLDDIKRGIDRLEEIYGYEKAYNIFCDLLEKNIINVFEDKNIENNFNDLDYLVAVDFITTSLCMKLYTQIILNSNQNKGENNGEDSNIN